MQSLVTPVRVSWVFYELFPPDLPFRTYSSEHGFSVWKHVADNIPASSGSYGACSDDTHSIWVTMARATSCHQSELPCEPGNPNGKLTPALPLEILSFSNKWLRILLLPWALQISSWSCLAPCSPRPSQRQGYHTGPSWSGRRQLPGLENKLIASAFLQISCFFMQIARLLGRSKHVSIIDTLA